MAHFKAVKEGYYLTLKRREKRRYISILHTGNATDTVNVIAKRHMELFGAIAAAKASLRLLRTKGDVAVVRCNLNETKNMLAAIALVDPPMVTLDMSSSVKRLKRRLVTKVNTADT